MWVGDGLYIYISESSCMTDGERYVDICADG